MDVPRAQVQVREAIDRFGKVSGLGPMPARGDLLRALRRRQGLSLEAVAAAVPVTTRTLRAWEKGEIWPSSEKLHTLCYALKAHEQELIALTCLTSDSLSPSPPAFPAFLEATPEAIEELNADIASRLVQPFDPLLELDFFSLMEQAWRLAARRPAGRYLLSSIYSRYAHYLSEWDRFGEIGPVAERSLELLPDKAPKETFVFYAGIAAARDEVYRAAHPRPQRGIELLRHWLQAARHPAFQAWILADMAKYQAILDAPSGATEALALAEQACAIAGETTAVELALRERDKARVLMVLGRNEEAIRLLNYGIYTAPASRAGTALMLAEAYLGIGAASEAQDWLRLAEGDIAECHNRPYLLRRVEALARRI
jgi:transcriptional regulator with XRE-family HTH domain